ncbi:type II toxin-antitoxin system RelE family toxin [Halorubrum luteum]
MYETATKSSRHGTAIQLQAKDWTSHRLEKLSGYPYYKLRAGDYRAIITWDRDDDVLIVEAVGHRRNIYDRHLPP